MGRELVDRDVALGERREATLRSEFRWQAARAGDALVRGIARAGELGPVLQAARETLASPDTKLQLVVPAELSGAIERGEWHLVEAHDGTGFLPVVQDANGQFSRQVRLVEERLPSNPLDLGALANAAAHARTHAMLREVLAKLDGIDRKLDRVLAQQRNEQLAKIVSGMSTFRCLVAEPGDGDTDAALLANALQSLDEGRRTLLLNLNTRAAAERAEPPWWNPTWSPSEERAKWLDQHCEDVTWLYAAAGTTAALWSYRDKPQTARLVLEELRGALAPLQDHFSSLFAHARYTPERGEFWREQFPVLTHAAGDPVPPELVFETTARELESFLS